MKKDLKSLIILFKAYNSIEKAVKHSLIDTGINMSEFTTMEALYSKGALSTQEIIDTILIPNSSMTYVLEQLVKKNYINKTKKADDKRVQILTLSNKGKAKFEDIYIRHFKFMRDIFDELSEEQEAVLQELLKTVGKKAEVKLK